MRVEVRVILLQITNAKVGSISSASGPNSIVLVNGKEYVEFDIRTTTDADEEFDFFKEYWVVDTDLYLYLDRDGDVYIYSDDLENFREFANDCEHKIESPFVYEGVSGDIVINYIELHEGTLRFMSGYRTIFTLQPTKEDVELYHKDYDKLFERMRFVYGK